MSVVSYSVGAMAPVVSSVNDVLARRIEMAECAGDCEKWSGNGIANGSEFGSSTSDEVAI